MFGIVAGPWLSLSHCLPVDLVAIKHHAIVSTDHRQTEQTLETQTTIVSEVDPAIFLEHRLSRIMAWFLFSTSIADKDFSMISSIRYRFCGLLLVGCLSQLLFDVITGDCVVVFLVHVECRLLVAYTLTPGLRSCHQHRPLEVSEIEGSN
jgi:hypothetical protein